MQRIAFTSLSLLTIALAVVNVSSSPPQEFVAAQEKTVQQPPPPRDEPAPHTIKVTVSGPEDTIMRVSRAGAQTEVELRGEPFEFEFTETLAHVGSLGIAVLADSAEPTAEPLRCSIAVDGVQVAGDTQTGPGADGSARVHCMIPLDI